MGGSIRRDGEGLNTRALAVVMVTVPVNLHWEQTGGVVVQLSYLLCPYHSRT
jgi:hypothetical protein